MSMPFWKQLLQYESNPNKQKYDLDSQSLFPFYEYKQWTKAQTPDKTGFTYPALPTYELYDFG